MMELEILYRDDFLVAINKPHGLLVHRTKLANDATEFALQILRDQLGQAVYPAHRLDRKTGGLLLFALNSEMDRLLQMQFAERKIKKTYLAIVRGFTPSNQVIDYPLKKENGQIQEAVTHIETLEKAEIDVPFGPHKTSRYSLVRVTPVTGRMHQIRKHLAHINHPIIGDRPHGCNKQNRLFKEKWKMETMMLHAEVLEFAHPITKELLSIEAKPQTEFIRMNRLMGWSVDYS